MSMTGKGERAQVRTRDGQIDIEMEKVGGGQPGVGAHVGLEAPVCEESVL